MVPDSEHALPIIRPGKIDAAVSDVLKENIKSEVWVLTQSRRDAKCAEKRDVV
jgi:hypothetical protein